MRGRSYSPELADTLIKRAKAMGATLPAARSLGISKATLQNWTRRKPEFAERLKSLTAERKQ